MSWLWWLSAPVIATVLASVWTWFRSRPEPTPTTAEAMKAHHDYLDALGESVRTARDAEGLGDRGSR